MFMTREMLAGLHTVHHFQIQQYTEMPIIFEENLFKGLRFTNLQIQRSFEDAAAIIKLTGQQNENLNSVILIDFRFNTAVREILADSFYATQNVESLYLDSCSLRLISSRAFNGLNKIKLISLTNNYLKQMSEAPFLALNKGWKVNISQNPFNCDCSFLWLREKNNPYDFKTANCTKDSKLQTSVYCFLTNNCVSVDDTTTLLCDLNSETDPPPTEVTTKATPIESSSKSSTELTTNQPSCVSDFNKLPTVMRIKSLDVDNVEIEFELGPSDTLLDLTLIWLNPQHLKYKKNFKNHCQPISETSLQVKDLNDSTPYIFCLKKLESLYVSPLDCLAAKTLPPLEKQPWLLNQDKTSTFIIISSSLVGLTIILVLCTYFILRTYPKLLRNENIVVINPHKVVKNPASLFVSDMLHTRPAPYFPNERTANCPNEFLAHLSFNHSNSLGGNSRSVYNTQNCTNYDRASNHVYMSPVIKARKRRASLSDASSGKNTLNSYIAVAEPSSSQLMNWRIGTWQKSQLNEMFQVNSSPPIPPPRIVF